jgi:DNA polymerase-3 subunit gamma/tau
MRFEDLVGQDHVARTLGNAIKTGRVAHAFLFTGVRGVGKTTSARILAKALNCMGDPETTPVGTDPGPSVTPCLKCAACLEIAQGTDVDVREIDGASYNGVDEVRKLQDSLPYRPARDRNKIFIVDEVHMLSQNAWNAFLKTLEEPPAHVKFIFATTEVHKVPITILSRVQRFDFKLISAQMIAQRLRYVLTQEGITADDAAVSILARQAAGSMRDAMSLLDQVIAWSEGGLLGDDVARVLGVASRQVLHDIAAALVKGDPARCLQVMSDLANQGYDMAHVARDLLALLRDLVVAKVCAEPQGLLDLPDEEARDVQSLAANAESDDLLRLHQGFSQGFDDVVRSGQARAALEMLLVRLSRRPPLIAVDDLLRRLSGLEQRLSGGGRPPSGPQGQAQRPPPAPDMSQRSAPTMQQRPREPRTQSSARPEASPDGRKEPPGGPERQTQQAQREPDFAAFAEFPGPPEHGQKPAASERPVATEVVRPVHNPNAVEPPAEILNAWRSIVERVHQDRPEIAAFLEHAAPLEMQPGKLLLGYPPKSVFSDRGTDKDSIDYLSRIASEHFGTATSVQFEADSVRAVDIKTLAAMETEARERRTREALAQARQHPSVVTAVEVLGARVKDLKLAKS